MEINLFRSLFKGRDDVFAIRWEKENKSGYSPAYSYDPYYYKRHRMAGGTFQNYTDKSYLPLSDNEVKKHLEGQQHIGVYPLLADNTSWFLVADFDEASWKSDALKFIEGCKQKGIPAYLERSRSGNGGHVWIFFSQPYPAARSRKLFISILEEAGAFSKFDKGSSFDRLFPNQDFLSGKGFGNLIALPLFKPCVEQGNSCFIDTQNFNPFTNQWAYLKNIERVSTQHLDKLYQQIGNLIPSVDLQDGCLSFVLDNRIRVNRIAITQPLINFLKEELNFANSEFIIRQKSGKSTFDIPRYFKLVSETEQEVILPRGFIGKLIRFCRETGIDHQFIDNRAKHKPVQFSFQAKLKKHQASILETINRKDFGVIVAPPAAGKTVIGLKIIADKQQPSLIIVHRKQLLNQWTERVESFLGIPKKEIGIIGQGKAKVGKQITIATIQSLPKLIDEIKDKFGTVILDECHHVPAETFRNTIDGIKCIYLYGLTATPIRKYNDDKLIFAYLGDIIAEIKSEQVENHQHTKIIIRNTELNVPYNSKTDHFEILSKILSNDTARNRLIAKDISHELNQGKKAVVITERKEHIEALALLLKPHYETVTLSGDDSENSKKAKWKMLHDGNFQLLITTGQYFGEGSDLPNISTLFLAYPFSFEGKLIQYMGRVQRSEISPIIYDYRDHHIDYLDKFFLKRNMFYRKIDKQISLFEEPKEEVSTSDSGLFVFQRKIKIRIEELSFIYGRAVFVYNITEMHQQLEFHIDNLELRPELEVLKSYFSKILKTNLIAVDIFAEYEFGKLVSQSATSSDIERIGKEIIEGVKFQFLTDNILKKPLEKQQNILTANDLQGGQPLYENADEILEAVLGNKEYRHSRHIRFLVDLHQSQVMKLRFVVSPFSFVFLLAGENLYHIVLETLDTEEATYVWHIEKNKSNLIQDIGAINEDLQTIKDRGRQAFITKPPKNFSRVMHDYTDLDKGIVIWKAMLEERLI